jgi:hypothetical protein
MGTVNEALDVANSLFDRWRDYRAVRQEASALIRLLYLECRRNLALLDALKLDGAQDDADYVEVAHALETAILEQVFLVGEKQTKVLEHLRKKPEGAEDEDAHDAPDALMRLYVRVTALQKIASLSAKGHALRSINYRKRLENVKKRLLDIVPDLETIAHAE